jgi:hypothetical protein
MTASSPSPDKPNEPSEAIETPSPTQTPKNDSKKAIFGFILSILAGFVGILPLIGTPLSITCGTAALVLCIKTRKRLIAKIGLVFSVLALVTTLLASTFLNIRKAQDSKKSTTEEITASLTQDPQPTAQSPSSPKETYTTQTLTFEENEEYPQNTNQESKPSEEPPTQNTINEEPPSPTSPEALANLTADPNPKTLANKKLLQSIRNGLGKAAIEGKLVGLGQIQKAVPYILVQPQGEPKEWVEKWALTDTSGQEAEIILVCQETPTGATWTVGGYNLINKENTDP